MRSPGLRHIDQRALALLGDAADRGAATPTNHALASALGVATEKQAIDVLHQLERAGLIRVARFGSSRSVTIVASGRSTVAISPRSMAHADHSYRGPVPEDQRVERDPCPRCGVRGDHGCAHRRGRIGMEMGL